MAKSQTFGKRENEKKKQAKRLEKQKRREERQAGGSSSLDDMIAYVDENGNITDTPPQLRPKVEIQLEDIVIATPKKEDIAAEPLKGRVEYFNTEKGYGFIIRKSKCSTDFKRNDFLKKNEAYPLGALRSLKFAYRKLRISLFVELAV